MEFPRAANDNLPEHHVALEGGIIFEIITKLYTLRGDEDFDEVEFIKRFPEGIQKVVRGIKISEKWMSVFQNLLSNPNKLKELYDNLDVTDLPNEYYYFVEEGDFVNAVHVLLSYFLANDFFEKEVLGLFDEEQVSSIDFINKVILKSEGGHARFFKECLEQYIIMNFLPKGPNNVSFGYDPTKIQQLVVDKFGPTLDMLLTGIKISRIHSASNGLPNSESQKQLIFIGVNVFPLLLMVRRFGSDYGVELKERLDKDEFENAINSVRYSLTKLISYKDPFFILMQG